MFRLFVNVYADSDTSGAAELAECLRRNRLNPLIDEVVALEGRSTFRQFFAAANRETGPDDITVVANSDIFFDETLKHAAALPKGECFALSRWNVSDGGRTEMYEQENKSEPTTRNCAS